MKWAILWAIWAIILVIELFVYRPFVWAYLGLAVYVILDVAYEKWKRRWLK